MAKLKTDGTMEKEIPVCYVVDIKGKYPKDKKTSALDPNIIDSVVLWEHLEGKYIYGTITLNDSREFKRTVINNKGGEFIRVEMKGATNKKEDYSKKLIFEIINVKHAPTTHLTSGLDKVEITIAQYPFYRNLLSNDISKGYSKKKISEIIEDIFDEFLVKDFDVQEVKKPKFIKTDNGTKETLASYCIPYWSLYKSINYLKQFAYDNDPETDAGYYCWADMNNQFIFKPLIKIIEDGKKKKKKVYLSHSAWVDPKEAEERTKHHVLYYRSNEVHKELFEEGLTGVSVERYDWFKKKNTWLKIGYENRKNKEINDYLKEKDNNNYYGKHIVNSFRFNKEIKGFSDCTGYNTILRNQLDQNHSEILINGITDLGVGDVIEIEEGENVSKLKGNFKELKGDWLVNGIRHAYSKEAAPYTQGLYLTRISKPEKD